MRKDIPIYDLTNPIDLAKLKADLRELYWRVDMFDPRTDDPVDDLYEGRTWIRLDL